MNYCPHLRAGGRTTGWPLIQGWQAYALCSKQDTPRTGPSLVAWLSPPHSGTTHIPAIDRSPDHPITTLATNHVVVCFVCGGVGAMRPSYLNVFFWYAICAVRSRRRRGTVFGAGAFNLGTGGGPQQGGGKAFPVWAVERVEGRCPWHSRSESLVKATRLCGQPRGPIDTVSVGVCLNLLYLCFFATVA
ncbi:hypothetical protein BC826DRAFT_71483 [Russula brevipes]|nr:hypothetical protein BC826DRAFT_71483 [Russula brevipes]